MAKEDKMIQAQKEESAEKVRYAKEVVDTMVENGETVTPYTVWKKSHLSKSFIYTNEEVKGYIDQFRSEKKYNYRKYTPQDVMEQRIYDLEKENEYLKKELRYYKNYSLEQALSENQILKHRLAKYEELEKAGIIVLPDENKP